MRRLTRFLLLLSSLGALWATNNVHAMECDIGEPFETSFDSGASWQFCVTLDKQHALELRNIHYRAPGDFSRRVLSHLHLGQTLLHFHDQPQADVLINADKNADKNDSEVDGESQDGQSLGGDALKVLNENLCDGTLHALDSADPYLCSSVKNTGLLAKYNLRPGLQGSQYRLFSVSQYKGLTFQIAVGLSEDGRIGPSVTLSGRTSATTNDKRYGNPVTEPTSQTDIIATQASVLYTWRMAFAMSNDGDNDRVEEFNFKLLPSLNNRRPMEVTNLDVESLRQVDADAFRGWRVLTDIGNGYYLDPQNSGFSYSDKANNWAQFDLAVTAYNDCEKHTTVKHASTNQASNSQCIGSLDDFVNGESIANQSPVLWYSLSRVFRPKAEDYPVVSSMQTDFEIIPFDWTPTSPFETTQ